MNGERPTPDDFAAASFARKGDDIAIRFDTVSATPWQTWGVWRSDEGMAAEGWTPVVEASEPTDPLDYLQLLWDNAEVADQAEKGDVVIRRDRNGNYQVGTAPVRALIVGEMARILRRAPRKTVAERLAMALTNLSRAENWDEDDFEATAELLMERFDIKVREDEA